ncbi:MAG: 1-phosphofructokinase [Actinomycetales bacterium]|jgi:1-phosphofructokinase family hexose kinase|uniref:1-phosphofructokinase n=1 Tax=Candidatus Phosphoribacter hodrii TaxID=2953743 RepID=A0A934X2I4_9MICO|nr:1-phosphofructokinase [Candidatus Phosphoribacter hodrii]OPZ56299.1 MAG: Tagatose-6-phosphate kinase [bacterium ADurb.BinA028]HNV13725.1 1-phosphofructokinase [Dermatophilaceae bacterium]MBK7273576.1 1-phosphofructokinase [Candidatus Phosphoribacter hodrii]HOA02399.1 1-phosphofructokinase [Dermatophilaceae bacterium]
MIVTLTPNPSIDRTVSVPALEHGEVNRASDSRIDPGGKGINVARALATNGTEALAVLPSGGPEGHLLQALLRRSGTAYTAVPIAGTTRMNIAVIEPDGTTTKLNEPGPTLSADEFDALLATVDNHLDPDLRWIVGCGSLTPGMPEGIYADLVRRGHAHGIKVAIDSSGAPFTAAVPAGPDLIKPNHEELEELVGRPLHTLAEVGEAARTLVDGGIETVIVSLGKHGALLVNAVAVAHAIAHVAHPVSTVGAGDSLVAGYLHAVCRGAGPREALATGVAWGAAAVSLPGSRMPGPDDIAAITVTSTDTPDLTLSLTD